MNLTFSLCGHEIPRIGMGTLYLSTERGFGGPLPHAGALLEEAVRLGVRFFDTADSYANGIAEQAVHDALHPYDGLLITTKGGFRHERLGQWLRDGRPEHLRQVLDDSLRRLELETVDLYQLHCPDPRIPYAESIGTLADLQRQGKIRHIGISNVGTSEIEIAREEAEIVSVQNPFNVRSRRGGNVLGGGDVLDVCETHGMAFIPWAPLGDGGISWSDPVLVALAEKHKARPPQIALSALLHRSPVILPIPGTSSHNHLRQNVAAGEIILDEEDLDQLWA
mgnify:FL=1